MANATRPGASQWKDLANRPAVDLSVNVDGHMVMRLLAGDVTVILREKVVKEMALWMLTVFGEDTPASPTLPTTMDVIEQ